ncbi:hypothetical protein VHAB30_53450 [Variovorax boronicumulans]|nr:hypothetical protein VHAB30_53450 [Variovorax boronicumulans]
MLAYAICSILAITWTLLAGKDVPWDALHYHVYAGYSVFNERLTVDLFPAGTQTYLNPYSHVPLYLMVDARWPAVAIGVSFALMQSVMLWMTWELARVVCRRQGGNSSGIVVWAAVAFALLNPVFLQALGSSFNDVTTGALALGGYVALASAFVGGRLHLVALGGALLGAASALKLSNATFALLPAIPMVVGCVSTPRRRVRALLTFAVCAGIAVIAVTMPWSMRLERAFGNPFFPMLDGLFRASDAATPKSQPESSPWQLLGQLVAGMRDPRFLPSSLTEAFARPFDMLSARRLIHTEPSSPDLRYAALVMLAMLGVVAWGARRRWKSAATAISSQSNRAYACLVISLAASWVLWLSISGNSRYFSPMACIAGVLLVVGLHRLLAPAPQRILIYVLAVMLGMQIVFLWQTRDLRWGPQPWGGQWLQVNVPPHLQLEPQLYLPLDSQSQSFLLSWLAPGSAFLGVASGIGPDGFVGSRARALIDANLSRLRMVKLVREFESDGKPSRLVPANIDYPLRRFGLEIDPKDCEYIKYKGNSEAIERADLRAGLRNEIQLYACRVVPGGRLSPLELGSKRVAEQVLDDVEDACVELFGQHRRGSSTRSGNIWRRTYGSDLALWVTDGGLIWFEDLLRGGGDRIAIGRTDDWLKAPQKINCWRKGGRAYVEFEQN